MSDPVMNRPMVRFDAVNIVFGDAPETALPLMDEGLSRPEIQERTNQVLGVHDCTLDVHDGEILDAIATCYVYDKDIYVWPFVTEDEGARRSSSDIPPEHLAAMKLFLTDFSGICWR